MDKLTRAQALRDDESVHCNCCQAVLIPFAAECGLDEAGARRLGAHFGSGMRHGATCGAVTGALMVLGMAGKGAEESKRLLSSFQEKNKFLTCAQLLQKAKEEGVARKCHCDGKVCDSVAVLEEIFKEN